MVDDMVIIESLKAQLYQYQHLRGGNSVLLALES